MSKPSVKAHTGTPLNATDRMVRQWAEHLTQAELTLFDRNITRIVLSKASICSVLLIVLNLSIFGIVDATVGWSPMMSLSCAVLSAVALIAVYRMPSTYCAMLLTQTLSWHHPTKQSE